MCGQIGRSNVPFRSDSLRKVVVLIQLRGSQDKSPLIRGQCIRRLTSSSYYFNEKIANDEDVITEIKRLINQYPTEVTEGVLGLIGKYRLGSLKNLIKRYYLKTGDLYSKDYKSIEKRATIELARLGDSISITNTIKLLRQEKNLGRKYSLASHLSNYIGGMQFAEYIFELYMSEEGLNKMEPLGRGADFGYLYW